MQINKLIRKYREKAGLTQQQVANRLFVQKQTYNQYETGKRRIDAELFLKIADIVNMNITIRERYRPDTYPNFDDILKRIKYFKMTAIKNGDDFEEHNIKAIARVIFFIDMNPYLYFEQIFNDGKILFKFIHLSKDFLYQEKKERFELLFKLHDKNFEPNQYSHVCPICNSYKYSIYDMDFNPDERHECLPLNDWTFRIMFLENTKNLKEKQRVFLKTMSGR